VHGQKVYLVIGVFEDDTIPLGIPYQGDPQFFYQIDNIGTEPLPVRQGMIRLIDARYTARPRYSIKELKGRSSTWARVKSFSMVIVTLCITNSPYAFISIV
jgi:hypothetical protein